MRVLSNIGLGVEMNRLRQENKPWTEWFDTRGGALSNDRHDPKTWDAFVEQIIYAKLDGLAPMLRGDEPGTLALSLLSAALNRAKAPQTIGLFLDTAALGDRVSADGVRVPFDFASEAHAELIWMQSIEPCLSLNRQRLERTADGRVPIAWWSLHPGVISQGMQHWDQAQRLLDHISRRMEQQGYGVPAHIVDEPSWPTTIDCWAKHRWFNPPGSWTTCTHKDVTVGVLVPGFRNHSDGGRQIARHDGATWTQGLQAMRDRGADLVYHESFNNVEESSGIYIPEPGHQNSWTPGAKYLAILRAFMDVIRPTPQPITQGDSMLSGTFVISRKDKIQDPEKPNFFQARLFKDGVEGVVSMQPSGEVGWQPKGTHGAFEEWYEDGNKSVFPDVAGLRIAVPLVD